MSSGGRRVACNSTGFAAVGSRYGAWTSRRPSCHRGLSASTRRSGRDQIRRDGKNLRSGGPRNNNLERSSVGAERALPAFPCRAHDRCDAHSQRQPGRASNHFVMQLDTHSLAQLRDLDPLDFGSRPIVPSAVSGRARLPTRSPSVRTRVYHTADRRQAHTAKPNTPQAPGRSVRTWRSVFEPLWRGMVECRSLIDQTDTTCCPYC